MSNNELYHADVKEALERFTGYAEDMKIYFLRKKDDLSMVNFYRGVIEGLKQANDVNEDVFETINRGGIK